MSYSFKAAVFAAGIAGAVVAATPANAVALSFTTGTVESGTFGRSNIAATPVANPFQDTLSFTLATAGLFSASLTSTATTVNRPGDLNFLSVVLTGNGVNEAFDVANLGTLSVASLADSLQLGAGDYTLTIRGRSFGAAQYSGNTTFEAAAVPEAATWLMMVGGFGALGAATRRRRQQVAFNA